MPLDKYPADVRSKYGCWRSATKWRVRLWHPLAKAVALVVFDKLDPDKVIGRLPGKRATPNWEWEIAGAVDGSFYQFEITQANGKKTTALDPFARSLAAFKWDGSYRQTGKAAFVDMERIDRPSKLAQKRESRPIVYEASVRDLTSLSDSVEFPGTFRAAIQADIGGHVSRLGFTHVQLMPVHACHAIDEGDRSVLGLGAGKGERTNYNWGYDPLNYFSINGWYSTDASDPYARMREFRDLVSHFHERGVGVILDVVYNHMFANATLDDVVPGYYFRDDAAVCPVKFPPLASERPMVGRLIADSLMHFVREYDVDGFRFDIMSFTDKKTMVSVAKRLREAKPSLVLHGEAWNFTDLNPKLALVKGITDNSEGIAYFNDTCRNAVKGRDELGFDAGLVAGNMSYFGDYLSCVLGNLQWNELDRLFPSASRDTYARFTSSLDVVLNYAACHDGHTLWDKVNLTVRGSVETKLAAYRQALMATALLPGTLFYLGGTELLYTKPCDPSGHEPEKSSTSSLFVDVLGLGTQTVTFNSYRTTDFVNGFRWPKKGDRRFRDLYGFVASLNEQRKAIGFFNLANSDKYVASVVGSMNYEPGVVDFTFVSEGKAYRVVHNFTNAPYSYGRNWKILLKSASPTAKIAAGNCPKRSSLLMLHN